MDDLSEVLLEEVAEATKKNLPMKLKLVVPDDNYDLAQLTKSYLEEGMSCISSKGRMKKDKKKKAGARDQRKRAAYDRINKLMRASEEPKEASAPAASAPAASAPAAETPAANEEVAT